MVRKEHAVAGHVHDPRRSSDVADPAGPVETVGVRVDERIETCDRRRLQWSSLAVCGEERFQFAAVHGTWRSHAVFALTIVSCFPSTSVPGEQVLEGLDAQRLGTLAATPVR